MKWKIFGKKSSLGNSRRENLEEYEKLMLADAQTSGGLLFSICENESKNVLKELNLKTNFKSSITSAIK